MSASPVLKSLQDVFDAQPRNEGQRAAFKSFVEAGLPTTKQDAWKYTDLRRMLNKQFVLAAVPNTSSLPELLPLDNLITFIDGSLKPSLPLWERAGERGVLVSASASSPPSPQPSPLKGEGVFLLLNSAISSSASEINIELDIDATQPIYIVHAWTSAAKSLMSHPRVTLKLARGSKATVIEHFIGGNTDANFVNSALDIDIGEHASLEHIRIQDDASGNFNIANIQVNVQRGGQYSNHHFVMGAGLSRTDMHIKLADREASADLHGLILAQNSQHLDVYTCIEHAAPHTRSSEDYRGIADQRGRVVFRGKVIVAKDAQKTDAKQSSRNLLLSAQAEIDTRPELEIYANDVKCAHGATVGQLDATSLFYLRSRGIDAAEARALLTHAFAAEVIERIPQTDVREHVLARLMTRMRSLEIPV